MWLILDLTKAFENKDVSVLQLRYLMKTDKLQTLTYTNGAVDKVINVRYKVMTDVQQL